MEDKLTSTFHQMVNAWMLLNALLLSMSVSISILYHFDQVFTIFGISVFEKADKFSFDLWRILKVAFFFA